MYIAMNRFCVVKGEEAAFERIWTDRDTHLTAVPGFIEFRLLRGPKKEDYTLFASHTIWAKRADFEAWINSASFRKAHANVGETRKDIYLGPPEFEGFETVQAIGKAD